VVNREDFEAFSNDSIGNDVRRARDNQLARFGLATSPAKLGMLHKPFHERENLLS
jgi:hypothetical protein